ncbi:MAG: alginate export family protein [bacterium]|nr:alginate export family protein [bacterium]
MLKRLLILVAALAVLIGVGLAASAQASDFTGSMWYRWEGWDNVDQDGDADDAEASARLRSRIAFAGDVNENADYNLTVENFRVFGDPASDVNSIYQATFTMRDFLIADLDVTLGRMPVAYGRERVIGVEDWDLATNILFDGAHGRYNFESGWLDYFNFKLQETYGSKYASGSGDDNITGLYMHYDASEKFWFEPYAMMMTHENWADPDLDNDRLMVFGGLVDYVRNGLHFYGEAVVQTGTTYLPAERDLSALGWYTGLFYDFDSTIEPFIGFEYNFASGDDAATPENEAFFSPYGSQSEYLGIMNVQGWHNVTAMRFAGGFTPIENLDVAADFFLFTEAEDTGADDAIGSELDIKLNYMLNADVDLEGGLGMFTYEDAADLYAAPGDAMYFVWAGSRLFF